MTNDYETIIGLEVHVQLKTYSKLFCNCVVGFGREPNSLVCPMCLGMPGVLPPVNTQAVQHALLMGMAFNCKIAPFTKFDRKNYFYPDLPKAYQISQYDLPFARNGWLDIETGGQVKRIRVHRIHLEEDAGKLNHPEDGGEAAMVDFNRAGTALCEMVSEADLRSPDEAYDYLTHLKQVVRYIGVSDCDMEKGSLRVDANVSARPMGQAAFNTRVEIKNLNSFKHIKEAIAYESARQVELYKAGRGAEVRQETRLWDDRKKETRVMRSKEDAHDYRYFPEPDIAPVVIGGEWLARVAEMVPELPLSRKRRLMNDYKLSDYDAGELTMERDIADYFEKVVDFYDNPKPVANWILGEMMRVMNEKRCSINQVGILPQNLGELVKISVGMEITNHAAKEVFAEMAAGGGHPRDIIQKKGLAKITDTGELEAVAREIIDANPGPVSQYKGGKTSTLGFFVGQMMKKTGGKADPALTQEILKKLLS